MSLLENKNFRLDIAGTPILKGYLPVDRPAEVMGIVGENPAPASHDGADPDELLPEAQPRRAASPSTASTSWPPPNRDEQVARATISPGLPGSR